MDKQQIKEFGTIFWLHLLLIIMIYLSPFLFKWGLILLFVGLYYFQIFVLGDCFLTKIQFKGNKHIKFHPYYLSKLGLRINKKIAKLGTYLIPAAIFLLSLFWQLVLNKVPLI